MLFVKVKILPGWARLEDALLVYEIPRALADWDTLQ
jgi:hypothetical protein